MNKNADPGQNWSFFGKKSKFSVMLPTYRKTYLGTLFALVFGRAWDEMGKKWQYLAQNDQKCIFWTNFGRFWPRILIFEGVSGSFGTNITENHLETLSALFWSGMGRNGQKIPIFGRK